MKIILTIIAIIILQLTMTHLLRRDKPENHIEETTPVLTPLSSYGIETHTSYDKSGFNVLKYTDFVIGKAISADSVISQGRLSGDLQFRLYFDILYSTITVPAEATHDNNDINDLHEDIRDALQKKGLHNMFRLQDQDGRLVLLYNIFRGRGSEKHPIPEISIVRSDDDKSFPLFGFEDSVVANDHDLIITMEDTIQYAITLNKSIERAVKDSSEVTLFHIDQEIQAQTENRVTLFKESDSTYALTKDGGVILINSRKSRFKVSQINNSPIVEKLGLETEGKGFALAQINIGEK